MLINAILGFSVLVFLFTILPFTISLPGEILAFFTGNSVREFFNTLYYFLPLDYIFVCILLIYSTKYLSIFMRMINWIWEKIIVR